LIKLLDDDSKAARYFAISGLKCYESNAIRAVPAISRFLTSSDKDFRVLATNALRKIAPGIILDSRTY